MKLLYSSPNTILVGHVRNLLNADGIECQLRNEFLSGGVGELPPTEAWPELWVHEQDFAAAQQLLDDFLREPAGILPVWICSVCGERIEGQFSACWRCGAERPKDV